MTAVLPGGNNAYVPSHETTGKMVVDFIRNPKDFPVLRYCKYVPVSKKVGYYAKFDVQDRLRITDTNIASSMWADGADAPQGNAFGEKFEWLLHECIRYAEVDVIGHELAKQATWDVIDHSARQLSQLAMTKLVQRAMTVLQTSGNWPTANTSAVSSISGVTGKWDVSTTARNDIKRSLDHGTEVAVQATGGALKDQDLILVISKSCARRMSVSQEIRDYLKASPEAFAQIRGKEAEGWVNRAHGLPDILYGHQVVVEDTVKCTSARGATDARSYVMSETSPMLLARPGSLEAVSGGPDFSTFSIFGYNGSETGEASDDPAQDLMVDTWEDVRNKRTEIRVITNTDEVMTAGAAGFLFTSAVN